MSKNNIANLSFEEALKQLEEIVSSLEEGREITLDKMVSSYSEGLKLAKLCQQKLAEAELEVQEISEGE